MFANVVPLAGPTFTAYSPLPASSPLAASPLPLECLVVIDASYSDTTILPLYQGRLLESAVRRLAIGGKLLTNHLKELTSLRHYNMLDETYLLNEIKEAVSFVAPSSQAFARSLDRTWKGRRDEGRREPDPSIVVDYVLPDYETRSHGFARPHVPVQAHKRHGLQSQQGLGEDVLPLGSERFAVPELLFAPSDMGIEQDGLAGCVMQSVEAVPPALQAAMLANVLVVGGTSLIEGLVPRLYAPCSRSSL